MGNCINCTEIGADTAMNGNRYVCADCSNTKLERVKNWGLRNAYEREFIVIDGLSQHKDGLSYYEWLQHQIGVVQ